MIKQSCRPKEYSTQKIKGGECVRLGAQCLWRQFSVVWPDINGRTVSEYRTRPPSESSLYLNVIKHYFFKLLTLPIIFCFIESALCPFDCESWTFCHWFGSSRSQERVSQSRQVAHGSSKIFSSINTLSFPRFNIWTHCTVGARKPNASGFWMVENGRFKSQPF